MAAAGRFRGFVILAGMRTGSNLLEACLNAVQGVKCRGEAFNPVFVGYPKDNELLGYTLEAREGDPMGLMARIGTAGGLNGFRYFRDHDPRVFDPVMADSGWAKVVLTRNPVESYASLKAARATGQWKLGDLKHRKVAPAATVAPDDLIGFLDETQAWHLRILRALQTTGQTAFWLDYEDLRDLEVLNGLLAFLGLDQRLAALPSGMVVQNPGAIAAKIANAPDVADALARLDRFNLTRVPAFEPRRGPAVPDYIAARGAPLLFQPVPGGPTAAVGAFLAGIGSAGATAGFTQGTLRQWLRDHPGHRSFTVLAHPVTRAWRAYMALASDEALAARLRHAHKVGLPAAPDADAAYRDAFLAFLAFLKGNLDGQTGLPTRPGWASQSAVVAGFAQVKQPDLIAREETLEQDLAPIVQRYGSAASTVAVPADARLNRVYDSQIERAVHAAYQRDYVAFGFGPFRAQAA